MKDKKGGRDYIAGFLSILYQLKRRKSCFLNLVGMAMAAIQKRLLMNS